MGFFYSFGVFMTVLLICIAVLCFCFFVCILLTEGDTEIATIVGTLGAYAILTIGISVFIAGFVSDPVEFGYQRIEEPQTVIENNVESNAKNSIIIDN